MTIREKLEEIVTKIKTDDMLAAKFKVAPVKTLEELLGVNLPDEQVKAAVEAIRAKLVGEKVEGAVEGAVDKLDALADKLADKLSGKIDLQKAETTVEDVVDKLDNMADKLSDKLEGLFDKR